MKAKVKKLVFSKETIANLTNEEQLALVGGFSPYDDPNVSYGCTEPTGCDGSCEVCPTQPVVCEVSADCPTYNCDRYFV